MRDALTVAQYIITKCMIDGEPITNLQLQKILYYVQLTFLKNTGAAFFSDEIEAWQFGPVVRRVYNRYCAYGAMPICQTYGLFEDFRKEDKKLIDEVVRTKRAKNPWELVEDTHAAGSPWARTYRNGIGNHAVISKEVIRVYG